MDRPAVYPADDMHQAMRVLELKLRNVKVSWNKSDTNRAYAASFQRLQSRLLVLREQAASARWSPAFLQLLRQARSVNVFGLTPTHLATLANIDTELEWILQQLTDGHGRHVSFADAYNDAFRLCTMNRSSEVRYVAEEQLRKLSLARPYDVFVERAKEICDIALYEESTYAFSNGMTPLTAHASWLYERSVARRWRRLRRAVLWERRIAAWRMAFDQVRFMPGGSGLGALKVEFYALAG